MVDWKLVFYPRPVVVVTSVTTLKSLHRQTRLFRKIFSDNLPLFSWPHDASDNGINCSETCQAKPQEIISQSL